MAEAKKGPFWLICNFDEAGKFVIKELVYYSVSVSTPTPSHKDIWDTCKGDINKPWNYYPRGRVEIQHNKNKAVIYANTYCFGCEELTSLLEKAFSLGDLSVDLKADNSAHYTEGVWGEFSYNKRH